MILEGDLQESSYEKLLYHWEKYFASSNSTGEFTSSLAPFFCIGEGNEEVQLECQSTSICEGLREKEKCKKYLS